MAKPSYNIKDVYKDINTINNYFTETVEYGSRIQRTAPLIDIYCHYGNTTGNGKCHNYYQRASSGVIYLLKTLKDNYNLEYDKLAEYAILWLRYKLNRTDPYHKIKLNDFYTNHIETNKDYNKKIKDNDLTYKEIINKKRDLMNINEMTNFSYPFGILIYLYNSNNLNCTSHLTQAKEFAARFEKLNKDSNHIENSSYNKILSTISNDYGNLKKKCDKFPSLPELTPQKRPAEISGKGSEKILGHTSEVTSSSSSISTTLIPALSIVSAIPVLLGIAYKTIYKKKTKKSKEEIET
ncbi:PIR protein CIR protein [Plasmodium vinckei petteri]|uniref:PIR protein CIR protein n=1 Tax=Plasmodium vinckei petteri TaxID=138298 RepID=A0A6V7STD2_PLAVN|nr:PIR protein CIR protein [Plasmodium vinckei petteri]